MSDVLQEFRGALLARGIVPPDNIVADGRLRRCDVEGAAGKLDAAYLLHLNGVAAGGFQNWKDGRGWENWRASATQPVSARQRAKCRQVWRHAKAQATKEREARWTEAQALAERIWGQATICAGHKYLDGKGIQVEGLKVLGEQLLVPVRDLSGALHSIQRIWPDGKKRFLKFGRTEACCFVLGDLRASSRICIVEGVATGATVFEACRYPVVVAFHAGNLLPVARQIRSAYTSASILICGDDDWRTDGNPGQTKAKRAAEAVGGIATFPEFLSSRAERDTDFNDMARACGLDAVSHLVERAFQPSTPNQQQVQSFAFQHGSSHFELSDQGVYFTGAHSNGDKKSPVWICSPLEVAAKTRDSKSGEWGRLLRWRDDDGVLHQWAMPLELLQGDGSECRRELARLGLSISPTRTAREQIAVYVQSAPVEARARCVDKLGWHGNVFATPTESIGESSELTVFQNAHAVEPALGISGTTADWRDSVAALSAGNTRVVFAISASFAGTLVYPSGIDSGGFHFRGSSSSGKSTVLRAAASVWGDPAAYSRLWRATANGLEGLASLHSDGVLILDELSQINPYEAGEAAYLLANGQGKARAARSGAVRASSRWRLIFLSAGEESLSALMAKNGRRANAGQELRLADIPIDSGANMGAFESLNGMDSPGALALAIGDAATRSFGAVGSDWLRRIVESREHLPELIADGIRQFCAEVILPGSGGQIERVARRFALVAVAGELATEFGLTSWSRGESERAAKACFAAWLESFGGAGNREERSILAAVKTFFELHGASRFESIDADNEQRVYNRAGFFRFDDAGHREFLVFTEVFKAEICAGFDFRSVEAVLLRHGWIKPGGDGRVTDKPRIPAMGSTVRVYVVSAKLWGTEI